MSVWWNSRQVERLETCSVHAVYMMCKQCFNALSDIRTHTFVEEKKKFFKRFKFHPEFCKATKTVEK